MEAFAAAQVETRIERVRVEMARAMADPSAGPVHDLRVSIRRLQQALRLFGGIWNPARSAELRARLRPVIAAAGEVRNRDIALDLLMKSGCEATEIAACFRRDRAQTAGLLRLRIAQAGMP
ncbi:MAG: CHAD domain-containing protein [Bryobacteraceae bacterium]